MAEAAGRLGERRQQTFTGEGTRLEIVATRIGEHAWSLAVINEYGVSSNWWEPFATPEAAFATALHAIQTEGVREFTDIEGFEYLRYAQDDG